MARRKSRKRKSYRTANQRDTAKTAKRTAPKKTEDPEAQVRAKHARLIREYRSDIEKAHHIVTYSEKAEAEALRAMRQASRYSKRKFG